MHSVKLEGGVFPTLPEEGEVVEFLIDSWEWVKVHDLNMAGLILMSVVLAAVIFRWDKKLKKPKK